MRESMKVPHFQTYFWLFLIAMAFTLALFGLSKQGTASTSDLADAGARVTFVGCNATNTQAQVLSNAISGNLQSLELRYKSGETNRKQYLFSKQLLIQNKVLVETTITDCKKRAEQLRDSVHP